MIKKIINKMNDKSNDKKYNSNFRRVIWKFYSNTRSYLHTRKIYYPEFRTKVGGINEVEKLVLEVTKQTNRTLTTMGVINNVKDSKATSFFSNVLYSETILMEKVNQAIDKKVPMDHETIKESMNEILFGLNKAFVQYCNINTNLLKEELNVSKVLRLRQEETRSEILQCNNEKP